MDDSCDITLESTANETLDITLESNSEYSMDASFSSVELEGQVREYAVAAGRSSTPKKATCLEISLSNPLSGKSLVLLYRPTPAFIIAISDLPNIRAL